MVLPRPYLLLLALASVNVLAEDQPFWKNLFKRQNLFNDRSAYYNVDWKEATKDVNWAAIDWDAIFGKKNGNPPSGGGNPPAGGGNPPAGNGPPTTSVAAPPASSSSSSSSGSNGQGSGSGSGSGTLGTSSATCSGNCAMHISFSDDTLDVAFAAGAGGSPSTGKTKGTCICMSGGSVRINIGTTNTGDHTTLIEGFAAGLSDGSFFDVSYVEGFNYPVVCWNKNQPSLMSGSNINLYDHGSCHDEGATAMGQICVNPGYTKLATRDAAHDCMKCTLPSEFFGPASGAAYTYPYDDCGCASGPSKDGPYKSPMATGGDIVCCVGPQCAANTFSVGGQTKMGNCNRPDCKPCGGMGPTCSSGCAGVTSIKRDLEAVFEAAKAKERKQKRRHVHHHHHGAES